MSTADRKPNEYDDVNGVISKPTIDLFVNEWEGGNETQLYYNLCSLAKSHECLRSAHDQLQKELEEVKRLNAEDCIALNLHESRMKNAEAENERLRNELAFVKEYLNPADTSFRQMIDAFKILPKEKQQKLIDLTKALLMMKDEK